MRNLLICGAVAGFIGVGSTLTLERILRPLVDEPLEQVVAERFELVDANRSLAGLWEFGPRRGSRFELYANDGSAGVSLVANSNQGGLLICYSDDTLARISLLALDRRTGIYVIDQDLHFRGSFSMLPVGDGQLVIRDAAGGVLHTAPAEVETPAEIQP